MMGRESTEVQATDINKLVDEHARLAYHSARAIDPDFQLDLKQELDPAAGEIEAVPQELGRVFLNMVGNACDATDEKRRAAQEAGAAAGYMPTLLLSTRRGEDHVEVRIRDNGNGMPPEVVEKIFNPFFTTKPTDRGTGLGLAISRDIVQKHGGSIQRRRRRPASSPRWSSGCRWNSPARKPVPSSRGATGPVPPPPRRPRGVDWSGIESAGAPPAGRPHPGP